MEVTIRELFTSAMILLIWYRFLDDRLSFRCVLLSLRLCTMVLLFFFALNVHSVYINIRYENCKSLSQKVSMMRTPLSS